MLQSNAGCLNSKRKNMSRWQAAASPISIWLQEGIIPFLPRAACTWYQQAWCWCAHHGDRLGGVLCAIRLSRLWEDGYWRRTQKQDIVHIFIALNHSGSQQPAYIFLKQWWWQERTIGAEKHRTGQFISERELPGAETCSGVVGTLRPPASSSWEARNKGLSNNPRPELQKKQNFLHFLHIQSHPPARLAGGGVGVASENCKCAHAMVEHLLVMRAVPDRSATRRWSAAFPPRDRTWSAAHRPLGESWQQETKSCTVE